MKRALVLLFVLIAVCAGSAFGQKFVVVIDPGHGGRDAGAVRGKIKEKDINLSVATILGKMIEDNHPDVKVVYTRKKDVFVDLYKRAEIANKAKANLFISIHTNSTKAKTTSVSGADTYTLGLGRSSDNLEVAKRENSVILLEDNYKQRYENFDPGSPESYIIFEFMVSKYLEQSIDLATHIQNGFRNIAKRTDRGVDQAGFLVLRETAMPSVLIELGFINNPKEATYLTSAKGQRTMANAIYSGFNKYKSSFDKKQGNSTTKFYASPKTEPEIVENEDIPVEKYVEKREPARTKPKTTQSKPRPVPVKAKVTQEVKATPEPKAVKQTAVKPQAGTTTKPGSSVANNVIEYRIQILTNPRELPKNSEKLKGLSPVSYYIDGNTYKYTYGSTTNYDEALRLQRQARTKFKDAFMVKFKNGKRVK